MNDIVYVGKHALTFRVPRHQHDTWELIYCTSENGEFVFDDFSLPYAAGTVVIIPPLTPHSNNSSRGFTNIHINMTDTTLPYRRPLSIQDDSNRSILNAFTGAFFQFYESSEQREALLSGYGNLIATYMIAYQQASPLSRVVQQIEGDIVRHYADSGYALDDYLHSLPYNYDYLRKLFQKELGMTPHKFLNDRRLQTAANMLCSEYSDGNVTEISHLCGFREPLYFSRMFKKKYGMSPSFYYAAHRTRQETPAPDPGSMKIMLEEGNE